VPLQPKPLERNGSIDALRGLAALVVLTTHALPKGGLDLSWPFSSFIGCSYGAVRLFFAISGYLVYKTYARRRLSEANAGRNFLVRRFFRIIPLWWLIVATYWALGMAQARSAFANFFFIFGFMPRDPSYSIIPPAWSLFVEELFYLAFPILFAKLAGRWRLATLGLGAYFVASVWTAYGLNLRSHDDLVWVSQCPQACFPYFFIGIAIARMQAEPGLWKALSGWRGWNVLGPVSLVAIASSIGSLEVTVSLLLLSALLSPGWMRGWLDNRGIRWVGKRCYCVYLAHHLITGLVIGWPSGLLFAIGQPNPPLWAFRLATVATVAAATLAFAWLSDLLLEAPMIRLGEKLIRSAADRKHSEKRAVAA
jgi:peptidoglycan/LPS O-acetylase OafA/YrhL